MLFERPADDAKAPCQMAIAVLVLVTLAGQILDLAGFWILTTDLLPEYRKYRRHQASRAAIGLTEGLLARGYRNWAQESEDDWSIAHPSIGGISERRVAELLSYAGLTEEEWDALRRLIPIGMGDRQRYQGQTLRDLAGDLIVLSAHDHIREMFWEVTLRRPNLHLGIALVIIGSALSIVSSAAQLFR